MPNIKSAAKRAKTSEKSRLRNRSVKSEVLTVRLKVLDAIKAGNKVEAEKVYSQYSSKLDKAAKKGILAKNNASRKKSRLALAIGKMA